VLKGPDITAHTPAATQDLGAGITRIDTGYLRPGLAACYLIRQGDQAAFVDSGTSHTVPSLLALLEALGIARSQVRYVMPTHVHLDHAGGAGELMRHLPNAALVAHPRGAPHFIDPAKLASGALAVYGEQAFRRNFGELVPVPEARVRVAEDGLRLDLAGRELLILDTPGHARHHYSVFDETSRGFFTGDTFGLSYRELDGERGAYVFPTTTPVQFDPQAWHRSLDRYLAHAPERMFLTHFGRVDDVPRLAADLRRGIDRLAEIARRNRDAEDRPGRILSEMTDHLIEDAQRRNPALSAERIQEIYALDLELNTQGLEVWLDREARDIT
jgi:glyoxylase-like metal-dependent hydrolase (beta-lactamase superfamily II)